MTKPYAKIEWNWTKVRQRIETLIEQNRFLSQTDREHMPEYERKQIAASIVVAYRDAPEGFIRPFNGDPIVHYSENVAAVQKLLRDPIQVRAIANELSLLTERTSPDDRHYEDRQNAVRQLAAYRAGEFSLFGEKREPIPEPIEESDLDRAKWLINDYCQAEFGSYADFSDLSHVGLAYTTDEADTYEISVFADLEQNRIVYRIDDQVVREVQTDSLSHLLSITPEQLSSVANAPTGNGLILCGGNIIPFVNRIPTDNPLYPLVTTKTEKDVAEQTVPAQSEG